MERISTCVIPVIMLVFALFVTASKKDLHSEFIKGVRRGFITAVELTPSMLVLMASIYMLNASGALEAASRILSPVLSFLGVPSELIPLILIRPISGSAATAVVSDILSTHGADSFAGRCASVLAGCTDTILYTVSVYFGAAQLKNTRHAIPAAFIPQTFAIFISCLAVRIYFG